ncbi:MAG: DUF59 domain-containing protein [Bacteroidales bacterium]|nr:DUF59 domain-containing protein [Bacteroidales bacterium]
MSETENTIAKLQEEAYAVLKTIYDPEIPVNIYDLGLIYKVTITGTRCDVLMSLTSPTCPMSDVLVYQIENRVKLIDGIDQVTVEITFDPPWQQDMISEEGQLKLGLL